MPQNKVLARFVVEISTTKRNQEQHEFDAQRAAVEVEQFAGRIETFVEDRLPEFTRVTVKKA